MVRALQQNTSSTGEPAKRFQLNTDQPQTLQIEHFITSKTLQFFDSMSIPTGFLDVDPDLWATNDDYQYQCGLRILKQLKVVNDHAESGVAFIPEYNGILTRKENQTQYLLQVVQEYRRRFPDFNKTTLSAAWSSMDS